MLNLSKKTIVITTTVIMAMSVLFACNTRKGNLIEPLYQKQDMNNINDGIYRIDLSANDIKEENGNIYLTPNIYSEDIYDTVDIHNMKAGDRIISRGKEELIKNVIWDKNESKCCINFPSFEEAEEEFRPSESGGTYYIVGPDDHHTYTLRGKAKILADKKLSMKDSSELGEPEKYIQIKDLKPYIEKGYENKYNCLNTYLRVEKGKVVELIHHYIP